MTTRRRFVESDGCTLKPIPAEFLQDMSSMCDVLWRIHNELRRDRKQFRDYSYDELTMIPASNDEAEVLSETDIRAFLSFNVQWVKLFKYTAAERIKSPDILVDDELSFFLDLLLFVTELHDPKLNLLTRKRRRTLNMHRANSDRGTVDAYIESPIQLVPMIGWRRKLRDDRGFQEDSEKLQRQMSRYPYWVCVRSALHRNRQPSVFEFVLQRDGCFDVKPARLPADLTWRLRQFGYRHGIEMFGTYLVQPPERVNLHFLPMRVHTSRWDYGVEIMIPRFYSKKEIRKYANKKEGTRSAARVDFSDIDGLMTDDYVVRSTADLMTHDDYKRLDVVIRKALRRAKWSGLDSNLYRLSLFNKIDVKTSENIRADVRRYVGDKDLPPLFNFPTAIKKVDGPVLAHTYNAQDRRLWWEYCRNLTYEEKYIPFEKA